MKKILIASVVILMSVGILLFVFFKKDAGVVDPANPSTVFPSSSGSQDAARLEVQYEEFLSNPATQRTFTPLTLQGRSVSLDTAIKALGGRVEQGTGRLLDQHQWSFYKCPQKDGSKGYNVVLSLHYALQQDYQGNLYNDQVNGLLKWEQSLLVDVAPILFPYQEVSLVGKFRADEPDHFMTFRYAPVQITNAGTGTIGYIWVDDELLIGNNLSCLLEAQELLYDTTA